jgi:glycosyltransferase involved in cell wall biosynthesis
MAEWSGRLAAAGHQVTILTSKPGRPERTSRDGVDIRYQRSLWHPTMAKLGLLDFHIFPLTIAQRLLRGRFDLVHTFNFTDTLIAAALRPLTRTPVLLHLNTIPPSVSYRRSLSTGGRLLGKAIRAADQILVISQQQKAYFEARFGRTGVRIAAPVDTACFPLRPVRDRARPVLLCASALDDRRKGGRVLMRAFNEIKHRHPDLRLELSARLSPSLRNELMTLVEPAWRRDVAFIPADNSQELAVAYRRASALILPSLWEAFPLVVLESLASGTPVVGTADGGIPEILEPGGAGAAFDPGPPRDGEPSNVEGLVQAALEVLELATRSGTPDRCRVVADRFSWDSLAPEYFDLYAKLIEK